MEDRLNELSFRNAFVFGAVIAVAYFFAVYRPADVSYQMERLESESIEYKGKIAQKDRLIKEKQSLEAELEELLKSIKDAKSYIPKDLKILTAVNAITTKARDSGLSIESISSSDDWTDMQTISYTSVRVNFKGSYENLMFFLSDLTREEVVLSIDEMDVSEGDSSKSDAKLNIRGNIKVFKAKEVKEKEEIPS